MAEKELVKYLWSEMGRQHWENARSCFSQNAVIRWHNTNETFNSDEFILINSRYPGNWNISIERLDQSENVIISVVSVKSLNDETSLYAVSFFNIMDNKIISLDEYWSDNGNPPQWRINMKVGRPIK